MGEIGKAKGYSLLLSILFRGCISQPGLVVPDESVANEIGKLEPN